MPQAFKILSSFFNTALYLAAGFAAPLFFKNFPDRRQAAVLAGGFFALTALRAVRLSLARPYLSQVKKFFFALFIIEVAFWFWRVSDPSPLPQGNWLHPAMSVLYVVSCIVFIFSELRWLRGAKGNTKFL